MEVKERLEELENKFRVGLEGAYKEMVEFKKHKRTPIVHSKDGKVVKTYPSN